MTQIDHIYKVYMGQKPYLCRPVPNLLARRVVFEHLTILVSLLTIAGLTSFGGDSVCIPSSTTHHLSPSILSTKNPEPITPNSELSSHNPPFLSPHYLLRISVLLPSQISTISYIVHPSPLTPVIFIVLTIRTAPLSHPFTYVDTYRHRHSSSHHINIRHNMLSQCQLI